MIWVVGTRGQVQGIGIGQGAATMGDGRIQPELPSC